MGRNRIDVKLNHILRIRVSEKLKQKLLDESLSLNMSISDIIRMKIMGIKIPDKNGVMLICQQIQLRNKLKEQGVSLKLIIDDINNNGITSDNINELEKIIAKYKELAKSCHELFEKLSYRT